MKQKDHHDTSLKRCSCDPGTVPLSFTLCENNVYRSGLELYLTGDKEITLEAFRKTHKENSWDMIMKNLNDFYSENEELFRGTRIVLIENQLAPDQATIQGMVHALFSQKLGPKSKIIAVYSSAVCATFKIGTGNHYRNKRQAIMFVFSNIDKLKFADTKVLKECLITNHTCDCIKNDVYWRLKNGDKIPGLKRGKFDTKRIPFLRKQIYGPIKRKQIVRPIVEKKIEMEDSKQNKRELEKQRKSIEIAIKKTKDLMKTMRIANKSGSKQSICCFAIFYDKKTNQ